MLSNLILALLLVWTAGLGAGALAAAASGNARRRLAWGLALGLPAAFLFHSYRWVLGGREFLEGAIGLLVLILFAALLTRRGWQTAALWAGVGFVLPQVYLWELADWPFTFTPVTGAQGSFLSGRLLAEGAGLVLGAVLAIIGLTLIVRLGRTWPPAAVRRASLAVYAVYAAKHALELVQVLAARGFPIPDALFEPLSHAINYLQHFSQVTLFLGMLWVGASGWLETQRRDQELPESGANPAMLRKHQAQRLGRRQLLVAAGTAVLGFTYLGCCIRRESVQNPDQEPPQPVEAMSGEVRLPLAQLADGQLHHYLYTSAAGIQVSFLALRKAGHLYGTGLNYCEMCGPAGYDQIEDQVVCSRCGSAINRMTVGLRGGCNPIPLQSVVQGDWLVITAAELDQHAPKFA